MELFFIILTFVVVMAICFIIGEKLDPRFKIMLPPAEEKTDSEAWDELIAKEPILSVGVNPVVPILEDDAIPTDEPAVNNETGGIADEPESEETPEDDPAENGDDVIRGCVGEVIESPEQIIEKLAGYARECAENIARALGASPADITSYVVDDDGVKKQD